MMHKGLSSTSRIDSFHGLLCEAASTAQIKALVNYFAQAARRARGGLGRGGAAFVPGYLFTQFLSSASNDCKDEYGESLENRYRFLHEVIEAIRKEVGHDFHLQVKMNAIDVNNAIYPEERKGNTLEEYIHLQMG